MTSLEGRSSPRGILVRCPLRCPFRSGPLSVSGQPSASPAHVMTLPPRLLLPFLALPLAACLETQLTVELFTQIHPDGTCTRRVEYRLERVDPEKGNTRVALRPEDDVSALPPLPPGDPWLLREEAETGLRVVALEAVLPSPALVDGDYFRARSPRAQPARNYVSAFVDAEHGVYEYQEVLRDPASPLAAARALSRAAAQARRGVRRALRARPGRRAARRRASPTCGAPTASGSRSRSRARSPSWRSGPSTAPASGASSTRSTTAWTPSRRRSPPGSRPSPRTLPAEAVEAAVEAAFNETGESLLAQLDAAGLPLAPDARRARVHFRATLVMPLPILRANTCVNGRHGRLGVRRRGPLRPRLRDDGVRRRTLTL